MEIVSEMWRPVAGRYAGWPYEVSSIGRVRSTGTHPRSKTGHCMSLRKRKDGYLQVRMCLAGIKAMVKVHRLVAEAFLGDCPEGYEVNHKSGAKSDNTVENLEYVTRSQNIVHAQSLSTFNCPRGESHGGSVLNDAKVRIIRQMRKSGEKLADIAQHIGVSVGSVNHVCNGHNWRHVV